MGELGTGGFATVLRAQDTVLGRDVALKVLNPLLMREANWVDTFYREARSVARLDHPNIVTIYEIDEIDDRLFIAMQLVEGLDLAQYIQQYKPISWRKACYILSEVGQALYYAHQHNILHRDLKPGNILMNVRQNKAKLSDFGLAQVFSQNSYSTTLSGGIVGTPQYIAPEIWDGQSATPQTDIYALGCILYELLTGKQLFHGKSAASIMRQHFKPLSLPTLWPPDVPAGINQWLEIALSQEPTARYPSVVDMLADISAETAVTPPPPTLIKPAQTEYDKQGDSPISTTSDTPIVGWHPLELDDDLEI